MKEYVNDIEELYILASKGISYAIEELFEKILPKGAKVSINGSVDLDIKIVCDGENSMMGYQCCLSPAHNDECWSKDKKASFIRDDKQF